MISPALRTVMISLTAISRWSMKSWFVEHCTADGGARQGYGFKPGGKGQGAGAAHLISISSSLVFPPADI